MTENWCELWIAEQFRRAHKQKAKSTLFSSIQFILFAEIAGRIEPFITHFSLTVHAGTVSVYLPSQNFDVLNSIYGISIILCFISAARFCFNVIEWRKIAVLHVKELRRIET